jgi:uncharacterized membrane protein YtjA (UPF0391 family)
LIRCFSGKLSPNKAYQEKNIELFFLALSYPVTQQHGGSMLGWTLMFLVIALIAGALGFSGVAGAATGIAKILFFIFIALLLLSLLARALRGNPPHM